MKLPDNRYTANAEYCGHEAPRFVPRFCGEWLKDCELWPDRASFQSPSFATRQEAIIACVAYENKRQELITRGEKSQARANFYEANK